MSDFQAIRRKNFTIWQFNPSFIPFSILHNFIRSQINNVTHNQVPFCIK